MLVVNLMIIMLLIYSVVLLSGVKMMFNSKYSKVIICLFAMYGPILSSIEGYKLGYTGIASIIILCVSFLLIFIWGYRINKHIYSINNVKQDDVINIIEEYFETKNIKYEVREEKIYLPEFDKNIVIDDFIEISLNCKNIKDIYFYDELVKKVRVEIKKIKKRYFPLEGMFYLACAVILYYFTTYFFK
ncbi:hypothetical protein LZ906_016795 (plasmid) [Paraclostridium ghonii]|uniref:hypothetical protein n=1 Tax=Paraclostridium ghonii TaxID=29358 RepID=UPI00202CB6B2|nr:hypothetical protein [Paeniclostridium ghonii]MCM0167402.1 hypothetical protein [Paeniclostridium ghonii]